MDGAIRHQVEREDTQQQRHQFKICLPLLKLSSSGTSSRPFSLFGIWVSKSVRTLYFRAGFSLSHGFCFGRLNGHEYGDIGMVVNNSVFCSSPGFGEEKRAPMEGLIEKSEVFGDLIEEKDRQSSSSSDCFTSETTGLEEQSHSSSEDSSPPLGGPVKKAEEPNCSCIGKAVDGNEQTHLDNRKLEKQDSAISEVEMMKERFAKLLLGEDMSGCGNGVSTALAISNAITNLCATLFGQLWRLEPLPREKKAMWRREMEWFLSVSDHIVELIPSCQTFSDGTKLEVMSCRPRSDLIINLPALRKLDNMLLEVLESFGDTEFWYVDQGILASDADGPSSFGRALQRQEEKWWLPVPRVPPGGLHEDTRKQLQHSRDCTNQILKAAMAINSFSLAEMEVPHSYLEGLPKNARSSLRDFIYRYVSSDQFSPECLLACLDLSSEHQAIEIANRVEASIYIWRKRINSKPTKSTNRLSPKSSWGIVKDLMNDGDKMELLAERAESLLLCLKQWFPGLPQTTLDMCKIQCNKDVGKSILESYSRVLESLAFNIVARIDDLLYVDDLTKHSDQVSSISKAVLMTHKTISVPYSAPVSSTPYRTTFATPNFSPAQLASPAKGEIRSPFVTRLKLQQHGFCVKKVLTDYLSIDTKEKQHGSPVEGLHCASNTIGEESASQTEDDSFESAEAAIGSPLDNEEEPDPEVVCH